jgi:hypothetical protein
MTALAVASPRTRARGVGGVTDLLMRGEWRRFAGAVRPKEGRRPASRDRQVDTADRLDRAKGLAIWDSSLPIPTAQARS